MLGWPSATTIADALCSIPVMFWRRSSVPFQMARPMDGHTVPGAGKRLNGTTTKIL